MLGKYFYLTPFVLWSLCHAWLRTRWILAVFQVSISTRKRFLNSSRAGAKRLIPKIQAVVIPETPADRQFLALTRRGLPNRALWIGKKVFNTGAQATVAHYHYEPGPGLPLIEPITGVSDIVVKENTLIPPPDELSIEDDILQRLQGKR